MNESIREREIKLGKYIVNTGATVRAAAEVWGVSKSTVHKDITERLSHDDPILFKSVNAVLQKNKQERHIRGGLATREKYKGKLNG